MTSIDEAPRAPSGSPLHRPFRFGAVALGLSLTLAVACGPADPELQVGEVAFSEEDLRGLSPERQELLAALAALGWVVAEEQVDGVAEPLAAAAEGTELRRMLRDEVILDAAGLDEDDLRERYEEAPEYELEVRHVLKEADEAAPDAERDAARDRAEAARERALDGEPFHELAGELSDEPGAAERGGLLEPGREGTWVDPFWDAAVALEEGEVSEVVETVFGFHVLYLEERRVVPFEEARGAVLRDLAGDVDEDDAWEALEEELAQAIQVDEAAVQAWIAEPSDDPELARWDGGALTGADFRRHAAALELDRYQERVEGDPEDVMDEVREAAREHALTEEARERGLDVSDGVLEEARLAWSRDVERWTNLMGFQAGIPADDVARRAQEALGATGQDHDLARREVAQRLPLLRYAVTVRWRDEGEAGGT